MIPKQFKILNHTIEVVFDSEYCSKNQCFGQYLYQENKIVLADKYKSKKNWVKYKPEIVEHVFYHELVHCVLYYMNHELWLDEKFVDQFAGLLAQVMIKENESIESNRKSRPRDRSGTS
jgi:hypothetical protein